jgi:hypothetical protein
VDAARAERAGSEQVDVLAGDLRGDVDEVSAERTVRVEALVDGVEDAEARGLIDRGLGPLREIARLHLRVGGARDGRVEDVDRIADGERARRNLEVTGQVRERRAVVAAGWILDELAERVTGWRGHADAGEVGDDVGVAVGADALRGRQRDHP